jgi:hypothetical protein
MGGSSRKPSDMWWYMSRADRASKQQAKRQGIIPWGKMLGEGLHDRDLLAVFLEPLALKVSHHLTG